jgi:hypothetical protein
VAFWMLFQDKQHILDLSHEFRAQPRPLFVVA